METKNNEINEYIFITNEGVTFQSNSDSDIPDVENMQVIGFEKGKDIIEAFNKLKDNNTYLLDTNFDEIIGIELKNQNFEYFNLK